MLEKKKRRTRNNVPLPDETSADNNSAKAIAGEGTSKTRVTAYSAVDIGTSTRPIPTDNDSCTSANTSTSGSCTGEGSQYTFPQGKFIVLPNFPTSSVHRSISTTSVPAIPTSSVPQSISTSVPSIPTSSVHQFISASISSVPTTSSIPQSISTSVPSIPTTSIHQSISVSVPSIPTSSTHQSISASVSSIPTSSVHQPISTTSVPQIFPQPCILPQHLSTLCYPQSLSTFPMPSFPTISLPFPPLSTLSVSLPSSPHQPLSTLSLPLPHSLSEPLQLPNYIRPSPTTAIHLPSRQSLQGVYTILSPPPPTPSASTSIPVSSYLPLSGFSGTVSITEGVSDSPSVPHTNIESLTTGGSVTVHHSTTFPPPFLLPAIQTSSNISSCIGEAMNTLFHNNPASGDETLSPSTTTGSLPPPQKEVAPINMTTTPSAQLGENVLISQSQDTGKK